MLFTFVRVFMFFIWESLFVVFTNERLFMFSRVLECLCFLFGKVCL
jgi:hypothetical protein